MNFVQRRLPSRRAFTLIELLVVVSIIALLISILLPSLNKAKAAANAVKCSTNIKALGTALNVYVAENDGVVPVNGTIFGKQGVPNAYKAPPATDAIRDLSQFELPIGGGATAYPQWQPKYGALWKYMSFSIKSYLCPADDMIRTNGGNGNPGNAALITTGTDPTTGDFILARDVGSGTGYFSYSVNFALNSMGRLRDQFSPWGMSVSPTYSNLASFPLPWSDPLKFQTGVKNPALFFCFLEEADDSGFNDEVVEPPAFNASQNKLTDRHNGKGNIGYGDGHVEPVVANEFDNLTGNSTDPMDTVLITLPLTRNFFPDMAQFVH